MNFISRFSNFKNPIIVLGVMTALLSACSPHSEKLVPRPDYSKPVQQEKHGEFMLFNPNVDILVVVDNSASMAAHQQNVANNIDAFVTGISQNSLLDYNIGVITSDNPYLVSLGGVKVVNKNTPNMADVLRANLLVGVAGAGNEIFLEQVASALSPANLIGQNQGFYRQDALLALIFITDAEDQGRVSAQSLFQSLVQMKAGDPTRVAVYSVIIPPGEDRCERDDGSNEPQKIMDFTSLFKGITFDLCDTDFGQKLLQIGNDITDRSTTAIGLKQIPTLSTIKVTFGSQSIPNDSETGWSYDPKRNAIIFGKDMKLKPEPKGTQMEVFFVPADL